jgi:LPXTG-site transpeptidase (sortase) family protein
LNYALLTRARYLSSVTALYVVTLLLFWQVVLPIMPFMTKAKAQQSPAPAPVALEALDYAEPIMQYGLPIRIYIPKLSFDREILKGDYDPSSEVWNVTGRGVHYAYPSSQPNDYAGNTLIYGHNNPHVFGPLKKLTAGDALEIYTENNLRFTYEFVGYNDYTPADVTILSYEGPPQLTLLTCVGYFNEIRRLYTFKFIKVDNI